MSMPTLNLRFMDSKSHVCYVFSGDVKQKYRFLATYLAASWLASATGAASAVTTNGARRASLVKCMMNTGWNVKCMVYYSIPRSKLDMKCGMHKLVYIKVGWSCSDDCLQIFFSQSRHALIYTFYCRDKSVFNRTTTMLSPWISTRRTSPTQNTTVLHLYCIF